MFDRRLAWVFWNSYSETQKNARTTRVESSLQQNPGRNRLGLQKLARRNRRTLHGVLAPIRTIWHTQIEGITVEKAKKPNRTCLWKRTILSAANECLGSAPFGYSYSRWLQEASHIIKEGSEEKTERLAFHQVCVWFPARELVRRVYRRIRAVLPSVSLLQNKTKFL